MSGLVSTLEIDELLLVDPDVPAVVVEPVTPPQYTPEQWEALKPVIERLYVVNGLPYKHVIKILRTDYAFVPTRRQFYRKIDRWGFKKNAKADEIGDLVNKFGLDQIGNIAGRLASRGIKNAPARVKRWQRRQRNSTYLSLSTTIVRNSLQVPTAIDENVVPSLSDATSSSGSDHYPTSPSLQAINGQDHTKQIECPDVTRPKSPEISTLLNALDLACATDAIPPMTLDGHDSDGQSLHLSTIDTKRLYTPRLEDTIKSAFDPPWTPFCQKIHASLCVEHSQEVLDLEEYLSMEDGAAEEASSDIFEYDAIISSTSDIFMPGEDLLHFAIELPTINVPSFSMEVYPFPTISIDIPNSEAVPKHISIVNLQAQEFEFRQNLMRLRRVFRRDNRAVLEVKANLAYVYWRQGKRRQSEALYRQIAASKHRTLGSRSLETLTVYLDVVLCILSQGHYVHAERFHRYVHGLITSLLPPDHELARRSAFTMAEILCCLDKDDEAGRIWRLQLQMSLATAGARDEKSLWVMTSLSKCLRCTNNMTASTHLLSAAVQLNREIEPLPSQRAIRDLRELGVTLHDKHDYRESYEVLEQTLVLSIGTVGYEHPETLRIKSHMAWSLRRLGQLNESEDLYRETLKQQSEVLPSTDGDIMSTMKGLGELLTERGNHAEASRIYKAVLDGAVEMFGITHQRAIWRCEALGVSYEKQGLDFDAYNLYRQTQEQISRMHGAEHPAAIRMGELIHQLAITPPFFEHEPDSPPNKGQLRLPTTPFALSPSSTMG